MFLICMAFQVFRSRSFEKELKKYIFLRNWVEKIEDQLIKNPYVGDPIRVPWFREKKKDKYRLYYVIYETVKGVLLVDLSAKKNQQKVINTIWLFLECYEEEMQSLINK